MSSSNLWKALRKPSMYSSCDLSWKSITAFRNTEKRSLNMLLLLVEKALVARALFLCEEEDFEVDENPTLDLTVNAVL